LGPLRAGELCDERCGAEWCVKGVCDAGDGRPRGLLLERFDAESSPDNGGRGTTRRDGRPAESEGDGVVERSGALLDAAFPLAGDASSGGPGPAERTRDGGAGMSHETGPRSVRTGSICRATLSAEVVLARSCVREGIRCSKNEPRAAVFIRRYPFRYIFKTYP